MKEDDDSKTVCNDKGQSLTGLWNEIELAGIIHQPVADYVIVRLCGDDRH